jgi:hypothetical protein
MRQEDFGFWIGDRRDSQLVIATSKLIDEIKAEKLFLIQLPLRF